MNQIIKSYLGVFLILFMGACGFGILGAFLQVMEAQDFHAAVVNELEDSNYAPAVMEECFLQASERGYRLEITLYESGKTPVRVTEAKGIPRQKGAVLNARVIMNFDLNMTLFQIDDTKTLVAYTG